MASGQPLLLSLDDAHWADTPSLRFVSYLARRAQEMPVLIAYAARPAEGAAAALPGQAETQTVGTVLRPSPLSESATAAPTRQMLGAATSERFARACHTASGGNSFLLHELLAALRANRTEPVDGNAERIAQLVPEAISRPSSPGCAPSGMSPPASPPLWPSWERGRSSATSSRSHTSLPRRWPRRPTG